VAITFREQQQRAGAMVDEIIQSGGPLGPTRSARRIDNAIGGLFWNRNGRELLFMSQPPKPLVMAADVTSTPSGIESGTPRVLFALPPGIGGPAQLSSVATPDGERLVFALNLPRPPTAAAR
jgi:hypothetical protein